MTSVFRRFSEASATSVMCSGRLSNAACFPLASNLNPNLVAITTLSRKGARPSPTSSSLVNGPYASAVEECHAPFEGGSDQRNPLLLTYRWTVASAQPHTAKPESG